MSSKPSVLFVALHNAGRSQMAAGYLNHLSGGAIEVPPGGNEPADKINPVAIQAMAEEGIDIAAEKPKIITTEAVKASDVVITMGCGDACPYYPGKRYEDWTLDDPAGQGIDIVRPIRDQIRGRVEQLIHELLGEGARATHVDLDDGHVFIVPRDAATYVGGGVGSEGARRDPPGSPQPRPRADRPGRSSDRPSVP
jgi:arsenate reductase (thioredoxin)